MLGLMQDWSLTVDRVLDPGRKGIRATGSDAQNTMIMPI